MSVIWKLYCPAKRIALPLGKYIEADGNGRLPWPEFDTWYVEDARRVTRLEQLALIERFLLACRGEVVEVLTDAELAGKTDPSSVNYLDTQDSLRDLGFEFKPASSKL